MMRPDNHSNRIPSGGATRRLHVATLIRLGAAAVVLVSLAAMAERARSQGTPFQQMQPMSIPAPPGSSDANQLQSPDAATVPVDGEAAEGWSFPLVARIASGGWLMLPLGVCSLVVFSLTLERLISLRRGRVIPRPFVRRFTECVEDGQLSYEEASQICEEFDCPVAEVFQAAVKRWGRPMMEIEQAVMDAGDRVSDGLTRFLRVFHAISNVAPLIGLLGTVLGMIEAFETMSGGGAVGADLLASGISVALVTTAGGLSVAIPAYIAYMYFAAVSDRYLNEIDRLCQRVIDCISAEGLESTARAKKPKRAA
jgi:biopolymer transport protein ExbB